MYVVVVTAFHQDVSRVSLFRVVVLHSTGWVKVVTSPLPVHIDLLVLRQAWHVKFEVHHDVVSFIIGITIAVVSCYAETILVLVVKVVFAWVIGHHRVVVEWIYPSNTFAVHSRVACRQKFGLAVFIAGFEY